MKILLEGHNSRFEMAEERTNYLEARSVEMIQLQNRKKNIQGKWTECKGAVGEY